MVCVLTVVFALVAGVVVGGVMLAYRIFAYEDYNYEERLDEDSLVGDSEGTPSSRKQQRVLNVMLLGLDDGPRTDTMIFVQYNLDTYEVNMLQIPRDTKIVTNRPNKKINASYAYGKEEEVFQSIKDLLGIDVNKYIVVNLDGFRRIVDEIGGVEVDVPINMYYDDPYQNLHIRLNKGRQVLDGEKAEMFVRFRKNNDGTGYRDGDLGRIRVQQQFISSAIEQVFKLRNIMRTPTLISIAVSNVKTNFEWYEILRYTPEVANLKQDAIHMMSLPGEARYVNGISYFLHDEEKTQALIDQYFTPKEIIKQGMTEEEIGDNKDNEDMQKDIEDKEQRTDYEPHWRNKFMRIEVLNGSTMNGVATSVAEDLKAKEFRIISIGNFDGERYEQTRVIDRNEKGYASEVAKELGDVQIDKEEDDTLGVDVTVIVGNDYESLRLSD